MGAQRRQRGKSQYAGPHFRFSGRAGRCFVRLSLLPFCQTASAFRLICLFHTFCRRGVYRAMVFAPLRCPKLFRFPFACLRAAPSVRFAHLFIRLLYKLTTLIARKVFSFYKIFTSLYATRIHFNSRFTRLLQKTPNSLRLSCRSYVRHCKKQRYASNQRIPQKLNRCQRTPIRAFRLLILKQSCLIFHGSGPGAP